MFSCYSIAARDVVHRNIEKLCSNHGNIPMYCTSTIDIAPAEEAMVSAKRMSVAHMIPISAVMIFSPDIWDSIDFKNIAKFWCLLLEPHM